MVHLFFIAPVGATRIRPCAFHHGVCAFVAMMAVLAAPPRRSHAITVLYQAPGTSVTTGLAHSDVEFENPLAGGETVLSQPLFEWRDADYLAGPPPWYDDWTVAGAGVIDGNANEVWMRQAGQSITTSTTSSGRWMSVHLIGDANDGVADVHVDGVLVATLDMGSNLLDRAVVLVSGLADTLHQVRVSSVGPGALRGVDVAAFGAALLGPPPDSYKWQQPPQPLSSGPVYDGWDELSVFLGPQIGADDWVCETSDPVTRIRWWGSYLGWKEPVPPYLPDAFHLTMWTDVPAGTDQEFSHPGQVIWGVDCFDYTWEFVGWDYSPITHEIEATFLFTQELRPEEYFQQPGVSAIYWLSVAAFEPLGQPTDHPWGWKTRPRDPTSPAPDDAVVIWAPTDPQPGMVFQAGAPLWFPTPDESWDFAFELESAPLLSVVKFVSEPEPDPAGGPCYFGFDEESVWWIPPGQIVADDWLCADDLPVTALEWWGSYQFWVEPFPPADAPEMFHVGIWTDVPAGVDQPFSHPGQMVWEFWAPRGALQEVTDLCDEYPTLFHSYTDQSFRYRLDLPREWWFWQESNPPAVNIYWLSVAAWYPAGPPCACNGDVNRDGIINSIDINLVQFSFGCPVGTGNLVCDRADVNCDGMVSPQDLAVLNCQFAGVPWPPNQQCCVQVPGPRTGHPWGWKTRPHRPLAPDDAVRIFDPVEPALGAAYLLGMPVETVEEGSWDTAFVIWSSDPRPPLMKWSQPPVVYTGGEPFFNGWDEISVFGGPQVVADDWVCSTETPVTDVHWWGSFLGWRETYPPSFALPDSFQLAIWTDVPAGVDQPFSHPGAVLWEHPCVDYTWEFVGWDVDPRDGTGANLDSLFRFTCDLPPGAWFDQGPVNSIFWLSIAAMYPTLPGPSPTWGWKTTPRLDAQSPDDAVVVFDPLTPLIGMTYGAGAPLWWPTPESSWDVAFELTTRDVTPPEACCLPLGACTDVTPDVCNQQLGVSQGPGTACSGVTIACCLPDGSCADVDPLCCDELGGQPSPYGAPQCLGDLNGTGIDDACEPPTQACCLPDRSCQDLDYMACVNLGGDPQGPLTSCIAGIVCNPIKWAQPPVYDEMPPRPECFNGWDEISHFACPGCQLVADDWLCSDADPISDIHWWGSYVGWDEASGAPPDAPDLFHVGIWSDVKATAATPFSHPGELLWQWIVPRDMLNERPVGCDMHATHPRDTCFRYDLRLPDGEFEWFYQLPRPRVYWISISAVYLAGSPPAFPWGWKTRPHFWNDDAVVITAPNAPVPGDPWLEGFPIEEPPGVSWDMAFVLTTTRSLEAKWSQPMLQPSENFDAASNLWLREETAPPVPVAKWDQPPDPAWSGLHAHDEMALGLHRWTTIADDWICQGGEVRDVHWWGNYELDDLGFEKRGQGIDHFHVSIHLAVPGLPFSKPTTVEVFGVDIPFAAANETWTGLFNIEGGRIYLYTFDLPTPFDQAAGEQYWIDITAFAVNPMQPAVWRWQEARRDIAPILGVSPAVSRAESDTQPPSPWQFISWPPVPPGTQTRYSDMAFQVTAGRIGDVNKVVADDFRSDGRPVRALQWWGSYFDPRYEEAKGIDPQRQVDGWLLTFHWADNEIPYPVDPTCPPDLVNGPDPPPTALGCYFIPRDGVLRVGTGAVDCLGHPVYAYYADLSQACLLCSERDPRTSWYPAQPGSFNEERGERYWLSIQAVVGAEWRLPECDLVYTGRLPSDLSGNSGDFWGWMTTSNPAGDAWLNSACVGEIVSWTPWPPDCWEYGRWDKQPHLCPLLPPPPVDMAFELLTPHPAAGACCWPDGSCTDGSLAQCAGFVCNVNNFLACSPNCVLGDVDGNGVVNAGDRGVISANFGQTAPQLVCICDLDGNGVINPADRGVVSANIGLQTPLPDFQNGSGLNNGMPDGRFPPGGVFYGPGTQCASVMCP